MNCFNRILHGILKYRSRKVLLLFILLWNAVGPAGPLRWAPDHQSEVEDTSFLLECRCWVPELGRKYWVYSR
jgi:hypothetical protein